MYVRANTLRLPLVILLVLVIVAIAASRPTQAQPPAVDEPAIRVGAPAFSDAEIARLTADLDAHLGPPRDAASWARAARTALSNFSQHLQTRQLTAFQEAGVLSHLEEIGRAHPTLSVPVGQVRQVIQTQMVGKLAPEIVGRDLDGVEFKLSDYRGKVVLLTFTGDWCGICRSQYPYERFLLDLYHNWPFAILAVSSDASRDMARESNRTNAQASRAWWDGPPGGKIATRWSVTGWPTIYLIDQQGVIRFVDLQREDLLKGVRDVLTDTTRTGSGH